MDEDAVSPVLAVVLMVAIVVTVSAGLFLALSAFTMGQDVEPVHVVGEKDERGDSWRLLRAPADSVPSDEVEWRADAGVRYAVDGPATAASPLAPTEWTPVGTGGPWMAGTVYTFCADGAARTDWTFQLQERHEEPSLLATIQFDRIAPCL